MPEITVLIAVHNGERFLRQAIDSVLAQTFSRFELLVVDDGSVDGSADIVRSYADRRVRLLPLGSNRGLSTALNAGLADTQTPLLARLDADDEMVAERLQRQYDVMTARPSLALLGSQAIAITPEGLERGTVHRPVDTASIGWMSIFDNPFIHPAVMCRTAVIRDELGGYAADFDPFSQDYDLWCRVMARHEVANLPDRLIRYRVHDQSIMGQLGDTSGYDAAFDRIARTLIVRRARQLFDVAVLDDEAAARLPGLILGVPADDLDVFLDTFEHLLSEFLARHPDAMTPDLAQLLARQYDALAMRVTPSSRLTAARVYRHACHAHPEVKPHLSWSRMLALVLLGRSGRDRVAAWSRRVRTAVPE